MALKGTGQFAQFATIYTGSSLDIHNTSSTSEFSTGDEILIYDSSLGENRKILRGNFFNGLEGEYISIHETVEETTPATNMEVLVYDPSVPANRRMTRANFLDGISAVGTFTDLTDTPASYEGYDETYYVRVNAASNALEFATVPSSYTLPTASADTLGGVKIGSRLTITDGVLSADEQGGGLVKVSSNDTTAGYLLGKLVAGANITLTEGSDGGNETLTIATTGGSSIGWTAETAFTATPASTSTLTMTADKTGFIKVGMALKYTISSVVYYGVVTGITSNLLTIAGAPMEGDVTALYYSTNPAQVVQVDFFITGKFADAANTGLLASDMNTKFDWNLQEARLVQIRHTVKVDDSGANQPRVNLSVGGSAVSTSNSNAGVAVAETWSSTVVDINTTNYVVARDAAIEIVTDANGSNDDASGLTVSGVFVII